jgi:hypothetical protein
MSQEHSQSLPVTEENGEHNEVAPDGPGVDNAATENYMIDDNFSINRDDLDNFFTIQGIDDDEIDEKIKVICSHTGLPPSFKTRSECEYQIRVSQCQSRCSFKVLKNDNRRYIVKCLIDSCPFRLVISTNAKNGTCIYDGHGVHTCDINDHIINEYKSPAAHSDFLSVYLLPHICNGMKLNKALVQKVKEDLGCDVSTSTVNRVLNKVTEKYIYNQKAGFNLLHSYAERINSRGGYADLEFKSLDEANVLGDIPNHVVTTEPQLQFHRVFTSIKEQRQYARYIEYICIDACHLKGPFGGVLMCATTLDPNKNMLVLAQAILPTENRDHWNYFLLHLKNANIGDNIKFIMSDRDKGLIAGVKHHFPTIPHGKCLRHLAENFKKKFGSEVTYHLERMAWAYTNHLHDTHFVSNIRYLSKSILRASPPGVVKS